MSRYPEIEVQLSGHSGSNGFFVVGQVTSALHRAGVHSSDIQDFMTECMAGDYADLLGVCKAWVRVT